ncbi:glycosyltransferase family 4 protein [Maribacter sp. Asnod2-G09]|uniref:glycosyltransferase family 4 protein n=1 Tax=Maribacter sp. Asnod2-G09 TaxID=3160577 RepID=UPI003864F9C7
MKKVLFILHIPPPVHGSSVVGKFIMDNIRIKSEFKTSYINLMTSKSLDDNGRKGLRKILLYIKILISILKQLLFNRPDLVYLAITAKGIAFYKDFVVVLFAKIFRVKLVLHFHNKGVSLYQHRFLDNLLYKLTFNNTKVILLSKYLLFDIEKYVESRNIFYCPNGIVDTNVHELVIENKGGEDRVHLLFLSNLIESKGVFVLLEACLLLKRRGLNFDCTFIGGEGDIDREMFQEKLNSLGVEDVVTYEGKQFGREKELAFSKADIFVFPTYYHNECFPLVLLEAMQYSLPIVSSFEGGIPDIVINNENGYLIEKNNIKDLAVKLEDLIINPEMRKIMGDKGRKFYEEKFTNKVFEDNFINILHKINN